LHVLPLLAPQWALPPPENIGAAMSTRLGGVSQGPWASLNLGGACGDERSKAFEIAGYSQADVDRDFAGMINAFKFGAPPHGGSAPGVDRIVMLLADEPNIREVITFPMNQKAEDLMMGAPNVATAKQLRELNIRTVEVAAPKPSA
jgi:hypothetical protein